MVCVLRFRMLSPSVALLQLRLASAVVRQRNSFPSSYVCCVSRGGGANGVCSCLARRTSAGLVFATTLSAALSQSHLQRQTHTQHCANTLCVPEAHRSAALHTFSQPSFLFTSRHLSNHPATPHTYLCPFLIRTHSISTTAHQSPFQLLDNGCLILSSRHFKGSRIPDVPSFLFNIEALKGGAYTHSDLASLLYTLLTDVSVQSLYRSLLGFTTPPLTEGAATALPCNPTIRSRKGSAADETESEEHDQSEELSNCDASSASNGAEGQGAGGWVKDEEKELSATVSSSSSSSSSSSPLTLEYNTKQASDAIATSSLCSFSSRSPGAERKDTRWPEGAETTTMTIQRRLPQTQQFSAATQPLNLQISREDFIRWFRQFIGNTQSEGQSRNAMFLPNRLLQSLFNLFRERNDASRVNVLELVCALGVFCRGSTKERLEIVFELFDLSGNNRIDFEEMLHTLLAIYRVTFNDRQRRVLHEFGVDVRNAEELARLTTEQCFAVADTDGDGELSIEEFNSWVHTLCAQNHYTEAAPADMQVPLKCLLLSILNPNIGFWS